jgi:hypothetical protein
LLSDRSFETYKKAAKRGSIRRFGCFLDSISIGFVRYQRSNS